MTTAAVSLPGPLPPLARGLERIARWLEVYSQAAVRIARAIVIAGTVAIVAALFINVFTRYLLGYSIFGSEEFARFVFTWVIWLGVSMAVKRGAVTVITLVSGRGPAWWRHSVQAFAGISLGALLVYACVRSTQYAASSESLDSTSPALGVPFFYAIVSMTVGYYFITLHYAQGLVEGAARLAAHGRTTLRPALVALGGALVVFVAVWGVTYAILSLGTSGILRENLAKLLGLLFIFAALTLAGTPIVFMLSIVGILSTMDLFGLSFYPEIGVDPLFPFRTTQQVLGLSVGTEFLVILMFLVVAEVMNASGMSDRLIRFAASVVGHLRGGMAYVCQVTSAMVSGISGSAQADAAIMTPLLVPAMEKEGYPRDVASAVVAGASIKGPIGPISIMFIVYGVVANTSISKLLVSGVFAELLLLLFQAATVYVVVRRMGFFQKRPFAGMRAVGRTGLAAAPTLAIPVIILGGILTGIYTPTESASVAALVTIGLALFWYASVGPGQLRGIFAAAGLETGIVMLLIGDSNILARVLEINQFGESLEQFLTGITSNRYLFLLLVNVLLLLVGIFIEPLPAVIILAPFLSVVAVEQYGIDPVHFGLIMVFNLVLALIHPPIGLVLFLVSSIARVSIERLSLMIIPWLAVSILVLLLVTYLPSGVVLALANLVH